MTDLDSIVARAVYDSGINLTPAQRRSIVSHVTGLLRENAQVVRMEMEHVVWGTVK